MLRCFTPIRFFTLGRMLVVARDPTAPFVIFARRRIEKVFLLVWGFGSLEAKVPLSTVVLLLLLCVCELKGMIGVCMKETYFPDPKLVAWRNLEFYGILLTVNMTGHAPNLWKESRGNETTYRWNGLLNLLKVGISSWLQDFEGPIGVLGLSLLFYHQSRMPISGILTNTSFLWFQASYMAMTQNDSRYVSHFWTGKYGHIFVYYL